MPRQMADSVVADVWMWGARLSSNGFVSQIVSLSFGFVEECHLFIQTFSLITLETLLSPHLYFWPEELAL